MAKVQISKGALYAQDRDTRENNWIETVSKIHKFQNQN